MKGDWTSVHVGVNRLQPIATGTLALLLGGALYLTLRPERLWIGAWLGPTWPSSHIDAARLVQNRELREFLTFSLPGGLWMYWATCLQIAIWSGRAGLRHRLWLFVPLAVGLAWELGQLTKTLPGIFDPHDVVAYLVGWTLGALWLGLEGSTCETTNVIDDCDRGDGLAGIGHELRHGRDPR